MSKRLIPGFGLTEEAIDLLGKHKIYSVNDFLKTDLDKLIQITTLNGKVLLNVYHQLISQHSAIPISGLKYFKNETKKSVIIPTKILSLDTLLNGGLETGQIYEIFGLSGSGKTQLCLTICANVVVLDVNIIYIDTKKDFSAKRISSILNKSYDEQKVNDAVKNIQIILINDIYDLITIISKIENDFQNKLIRADHTLLIIDTISSVYFPMVNSHFGHEHINLIATNLQQLARENSVAVLISNLGMPLFDSEFKKENENTTENLNVDIRPAIGKFWNHVPDVRLLISKVADRRKEKRLIKIVKSNFHPLEKYCLVNLGECGIE